MKTKPLTLKRMSVAIAVLLLVVLSNQPAQLVLAQAGPGWQPQVVLSEDILDEAGDPADCFRPVVVGDSWGQVHAFWGARTNPDRGVMGNAIYYARWDEHGWSQPSDVIFVDDANNQHAVPRVAVDEGGKLHLVWLRRGTLRYSRASVWQADQARAWAEPLLVSEGPVPGGDNVAAILTDSRGTVHVVHSLGLQGGTFVHTFSDHGAVWSDPHLIATGDGGNLINAAVDEQDVLHVVYVMSLGEARGVYYTRSHDRGATWSDALLVDRLDDRYQGSYAPHYINVITHGDQVHIVWHGTPRSQRWHQWSADGGLTWSDPVQISPDLVFLTNPPQMSFDGSGVLHLVSVGAGAQPGDEGTAVFHTTWRGGRWTPLELISTESDERADIAIGDANTLVVVWDNQVTKDNTADNDNYIWASTKELDASPLPVAPRPSATPTLSAVDAAGPTSLPTSSPTPTSHGSPATTVNREMQHGPGTSVSMGALAAGVLVAVVVLLRRPWR